MTYSDTTAVHHCRSQVVDGVACDLPNVQELARLFCDALFIDSLDPTAASNTPHSLATIFNDFAWSSTDFSNQVA